MVDRVVTTNRVIVMDSWDVESESSEPEEESAPRRIPANPWCLRVSGSRVADHRVLVEKLQSRVLGGVQVFGLQDCADRRGGLYCSYSLVVWPKGIPTKEELSPNESDWHAVFVEIENEVGCGVVTASCSVVATCARDGESIAAFVARSANEILVWADAMECYGHEMTWFGQLRFAVPYTETVLNEVRWFTDGSMRPVQTVVMKEIVLLEEY